MLNKHFVKSMQQVFCSHCAHCCWIKCKQTAAAAHQSQWRMECTRTSSRQTLTYIYISLLWLVFFFFFAFFSLNNAFPIHQLISYRHVFTHYSKATPCKRLNSVCSLRSGEAICKNNRRWCMFYGLGAPGASLSSRSQNGIKGHDHAAKISFALIKTCLALEAIPLLHDPVPCSSLGSGQPFPWLCWTWPACSPLSSRLSKT